MSDLGNFESIVRITREIRGERLQQDEKWGRAHDVADGTGPDISLAGHTHADWRDSMQQRVDRLAARGSSTMASVLLEEVFEALAETDQAKLRTELIQVAAVAAKWVQIIDERAS